MDSRTVLMTIIDGEICGPLQQLNPVVASSPGPVSNISGGPMNNHFREDHDVGDSLHCVTPMPFALGLMQL